jgi:hypothetical protein
MSSKTTTVESAVKALFPHLAWRELPEEKPDQTIAVAHITTSKGHGEKEMDVILKRLCENAAGFPSKDHLCVFACKTEDGFQAQFCVRLPPTPETKKRELLRERIRAHFPNAIIDPAPDFKYSIREGQSVRGFRTSGNTLQDLDTKLLQMKIALDRCKITQDLITVSISKLKDEYVLDLTCFGEVPIRSKL